MSFEKTPADQPGEDDVCIGCEFNFGTSLDARLRTRHAWQCPRLALASLKADGGTGSHVCCDRRAIASIASAFDSDDSIVSYVRTRLRTVTAGAFSVSRHTADFAAYAMRARILSETDVMVHRVLDLAALRYSRDGSRTVTQEDVMLALRSLACDES